MIKEFDVSIIIINFNQFTLLYNCLNTLEKFINYISYEIIVVDNNSTDGDIELITNEFENIKLIKNEKNEGFAKANNRGSEIAEGKYLLLLNNDVEFFQNSIKDIFDFMEKRESEQLVGCKLLNKDYSIQTSVQSFPTLLNVFGANFFLYKIYDR